MCAAAPTRTPAPRGAGLPTPGQSPDLVQQSCQKERKEEEKDYAFQRHFDEKPSIIPGCPGAVLPRVKMSCSWLCIPVENDCPAL